VAHRESGHTPDKDVPEYWNGGIKWLSLTDCDRLNRIYIGDTSKTISQAGIENSSARLLPAGVVVLSRDAGVGQSAITTCPMAVSQHFLAWKCSDRIDSLFLYYWFQHLRPELERIAVGSTIKTIGLWYFDRMRIPLPPIQAQTFIAAALKEFDGLADGVQRLIDAKRTFKRGLLQQLLTGRRRFPQFVKSKSRQPGQFGTVPKDWSVVHIGDIAKEVKARGAVHGSVVYSCTKHDGLVPSLEYFGRQVFSRNLDGYKRIGSGDFVYATNHIEEGSIGLLREGHPPGLVSPMYTAFRPIERVNPEFLYAQLKTETYRRVFEARMSASVDRRGSLRWTEFCRIKIGLPSIEEQNRIADTLRLAEHEIDRLVRLHELIEMQKRTLLSKLLLGDASGSFP